ncbi:hypothetical protein ACFFMN_21435 [Planobispora siamensis]|uniref:Uncharacterized protein n=1 Tax=Planobispora siamensis TaxID=936338 RepID=A0A8J3WNB7_9ACTN|nr:hypothetical protein [Planobispora siamensis]GIH93706.1 hypothetical protein Psi01_43360 [Planobispora siamensis]
MNQKEREKEKEREQLKGTTFDPELHNMGGDVGPASIRGSNAKPGGDPDDDAAPKSGWSEPMGNMTGRDDERPEIAGSDEKSVGARTDEIEGHTPASSEPHRMPFDPDESEGGPDYARRARGPVETGPDDDGPLPDRTIPDTGGHVGADMDWKDSDVDDPDGGSGRTDEGDGGYLPGEGTGRPPV